MHQRVVDLRAVGDGAVAREGPGRGGPDDDGGVFEAGVAGGDDGEADADGVAGAVVVFDLGFGESGALHRAPHHRPQAAVERAVQQELADLAGDGGLGAVVEGGVALFPVAGDAEALELGGLHLEPMLAVAAAFVAELQDGDGVLVAAGGAVFLLHLPLDRQAVRVPAGDVRGVLAGHAVGAHEHVLEDAVQRVADVQVAVGVDRPVVQEEAGAAAHGVDGALPQLDAVPAGEQIRLALRQVAAHREGGGRQEDGGFVVGCVGHGFARGRLEGARAGPAVFRRPGG